MSRVRRAIKPRGRDSAAARCREPRSSPNRRREAGFTPEAVLANRSANTSSVSGFTGSAPVQRRAPGAEVDTFDVLVRNLAHAEFISKIRRCGDRAAMFVKRLRSARGASKKQRRHHHNGVPKYSSESHAPIKPHVVVQREPADADVIRPEWTTSPMARMFASRFACVSMTPLGRRGTGGVLQER